MWEGGQKAWRSLDRGVGNIGVEKECGIPIKIFKVFNPWRCEGGRGRGGEAGRQTAE